MKLLARNILAIGLLSACRTVGVTPDSTIQSSRPASEALASSIDQEKVGEAGDQAVGMLSNEDPVFVARTTKQLASLLCGVEGDESEAAKRLQSIDGISVQGYVDLVNILARGASPVSVTGGIETTFWFTEDPNVLDMVVYAVPGAAGSLSPANQWPPVDLSLGLIYGCQADTNRYSGYFASLSAGDVTWSLGADTGALWDKVNVKKNDPLAGDIDGDGRISHGEVKQTIETEGNKLKAFADARLSRASHHEGSLYNFRSAYVHDQTMAKIMEEVQVSVHHNVNWQTNLDELFRKGIHVVDQIFSSNSNGVIEHLDASYELTKQPGESEANYALRFPVLVPIYTEMADYFWGSGEQGGTPEQPNGLLQSLFVVSGHGYGANYNKDLFAVAFATKARSSVGPEIGMVKDDYAHNVRRYMLTNDRYGCRGQRSHHPETRWFKVRVNGRDQYFDCMGFGPGETYKEDVSYRLYFADDFERIVQEIHEIKEFFDLLESFRVATHYAALHAHDAFYTRKDLMKMVIGDTNAAPILTGCNSTTMGSRSLASPGMAGLNTIALVGQTLRDEMDRSMTLVSAMANAVRGRSAGASLSYYYPIWRKKIPITTVAKAIAGLKNASCRAYGIKP